MNTYPADIKYVSVVIVYRHIRHRNCCQVFSSKLNNNSFVIIVIRQFGWLALHAIKVRFSYIWSTCNYSDQILYHFLFFKFNFILILHYQKFCVIYNFWGYISWSYYKYHVFIPMIWKMWNYCYKIIISHKKHFFIITLKTKPKTRWYKPKKHIIIMCLVLKTLPNSKTLKTLFSYIKTSHIAEQ